MPEVALHILNCAVFLDVCGGCAAERLLGQIVDADKLRQGLQLFLQIVADAEGRSPAIQEEKRPPVVALRMKCDPLRNLAAQIRRNRYVAIALVCFCPAEAILSQLSFLQCLVDSKLITFESSMRNARASAGRRPHTA
jgi:hypothetical protein